MTPSKLLGFVSILAGGASFVGLVDGVSIPLTASVGIVCGGIAVHKKHKVLGWIGISLNLLAPLVMVLLLWHWGWFDKNALQ